MKGDMEPSRDGVSDQPRVAEASLLQERASVLTTPGKLSSAGLHASRTKQEGAIHAGPFTPP